MSRSRTRVWLGFKLTGVQAQNIGFFLQAVVAVFKDLGGDQKAAILQGLLKKVVGSVTSM